MNLLLNNMSKHAPMSTEKPITSTPPTLHMCNIIIALLSTLLTNLVRSHLVNPSWDQLRKPLGPEMGSCLFDHSAVIIFASILHSICAFSTRTTGRVKFGISKVLMRKQQFGSRLEVDNSSTLLLLCTWGRYYTLKFLD